MTQPTNAMMLLRFAMAAVVPLAVAVSVSPAQVPTNGTPSGRATQEVVLKVPGMT